jgi:hypothetical protein
VLEAVRRREPSQGLQGKSVLPRKQQSVYSSIVAIYGYLSVIYILTLSLIAALLRKVTSMANSPVGQHDNSQASSQIGCTTDMTYKYACKPILPIRISTITELIAVCVCVLVEDVLA